MFNFTIMNHSTFAILIINGRIFGAFYNRLGLLYDGAETNLQVLNSQISSPPEVIIVPQIVYDPVLNHFKFVNFFLVLFIKFVTESQLLACGVKRVYPFML